MGPWPWQVPGRDGFYSILGAYALAYVEPAKARATGHDGYIAYLIAAEVRTRTHS